MSKSFTGDEFVKALAEGSLKQPIILTGMAKPAENDSNAILFADGGSSCSSWIKIPVEMIDKVEHLTTIACRDHEHPLIRLYLKEPSAENTVAAVLTDLLRKSQRPGVMPTVSQGFSMGAIFARTAGGSGQRQLQGCFLLHVPLCFVVQRPRPGPNEPPPPADPGSDTYCVDVLIPVCY